MRVEDLGNYDYRYGFAFSGWKSTFLGPAQVNLWWARNDEIVTEDEEDKFFSTEGIVTTLGGNWCPTEVNEKGIYEPKSMKWGYCRTNCRIDGSKNDFIISV